MYAVFGPSFWVPTIDNPWNGPLKDFFVFRGIASSQHQSCRFWGYIRVARSERLFMPSMMASSTAEDTHMFKWDHRSMPLLAFAGLCFQSLNYNWWLHIQLDGYRIHPTILTHSAGLCVADTGTHLPITISGSAESPFGGFGGVSVWGRVISAISILSESSSLRLGMVYIRVGRP